MSDSKSPPNPPRKGPGLPAACGRAFILIVLMLVLFLGVLGMCVLTGLPAWCAVLPPLFLVFGWWRWRSSRRAMAIGIVVIVLAMLAWRGLLTPSHNRTWSPQWAELAKATQEGDLVTIENVRNFSWNEDGTFQPSWETRTYDLAKLSSLDLWVHPLGGSDLVAHNMLSFGFGEDGHLVVSVESRREAHEKFGLLPGMLNQFELIYLFVSESDTLTKRVLVDGDPLYRYPVKGEQMRTLFLSLVESANALREKPEFYALVRHNCTNILAKHADRHLDRKIGFTLDTVFSARTPYLLQEHGFLKDPLGPLENYREDAAIAEFPNDPALGLRLREKKGGED